MLRPLAHFLLLTLAPPVVAIAQTTTCMSVDSFGNQPQGSSGGFGGTAISADGRHVVFDTYAWLVPGGAPALVDHDRLTGETVLVAPWISHSPSMSADGRLVAFETLYGLVAEDTNGGADLYVWDRQTGLYEPLNVSTAGERAAIPSPGGMPSISADGRFVAFNSAAGNLAPGDTYSGVDVFLRDRLLGTTTLLSSAGGGGYEAAISDTGNWVAYAGLTDQRRVQLWSRAVGSVTSVDAGISTPGIVQEPSVSRDGRFIVFKWVNAGTASEVYLKDRVLDTTELISTPANGPSFGGGYEGRITPDGRYITFAGGDSRAYMVDRVLGTSECVSRTWSGELAGGERLSVTPDGRFIAFRSFSANVVPNQTNSPGIFLRDRAAMPEVVAYCFGDGSGGACPCANVVPAGTPSGCMNSAGLGASLSASGTASIAADTVLLTTTGIPSSASLYVRGTSRISGGIGTAFGDGLRCIAGTLTRLGTRPTSGGTSTFPAPNLRLSQYGALAGVAQQYQTWYRNPAPAFCAPGTFNLSNGLTILWGP